MLAGRAHGDPPEVHEFRSKNAISGNSSTTGLGANGSSARIHSEWQQHLRHRRQTCLWLCLGVSGWSVLSQAGHRLDLHDLPLGVAPSHQQHGLELIHYVVGTSLSLSHMRAQRVHRPA